MIRPAARILVLHNSEGRLGAEEGAGQVDGNDLLPLFVFEVFQQHGWRSGPGVIEQYIESAKALFCLGEQRGNGLGIADVGGYR